MEIGTLQELDVKPGDVVAWHKSAKGWEWQDKNFSGVDDFVVKEDGSIWSKSANNGFDGYNEHIFRIISRASDETPKLWRDMTPEEKGALLLAHHEGKVIELYNPSGLKRWVKCAFPEDFWNWDTSYRVKPELERKVVEFTDKHISFKAIKGHRITFETVDGKPDCSTINMEEL